VIGRHRRAHGITGLDVFSTAQRERTIERVQQQLSVARANTNPQSLWLVIARRRSRRSNPEFTARTLDCFAALAMTVRDFADWYKLTVTRSLMAIFGLYENVSGEIDSGMRFSPPSKGDRQRRTRLYAAVAA
jgi:hypothetical protein